MKKALLTLLLFITSTAQAEPRRTVYVKDTMPPRKALTDIGGHLQVEHSRAMTNSKRRPRAKHDLDSLLDKMVREARWEMELERFYNEFFGGGEFPIHEKYEYEWSSGDTDDVDPDDNDDYTITITDQ
tara:strand:- start:418 stop:801 length:384 start_codon:yes stop_codon:yes gene_type:complete